MPLSKARNAARMRLKTLEKKGLQPDCNLAISALPPDERKRVLAEIALHSIERPVSAGHKVAAIKELNLMEHIYDNFPQVSDNRVINFIISGEQGTELIEGISKRLTEPKEIEEEVKHEP